MIPPRVARLNADGSTDVTFDPGYGPNATALGVAVTASGNSAVGGQFTSINGTARANYALFDTDGGLSPDLTGGANNPVRVVLAQADERVIITGNFTEASGESRNRIARLSSTGLLEASFNPNANGIIWASALQQDGKILIGGDFTTVGSSTRGHLARLLNDTAVESLSILPPSTALWQRSVSCPETQRVEFDTSDDGGATWTPEGEGTRVAGGWELPGITFDSDGHLRARAFPPSGTSQGIVEQVIAFDFVPEIQVEQPSGNILVDGANTVDFGEAQVGATTERTFEVRNVGLDDLTLGTLVPPVLPVTLSGSGAASWTILNQPPDLLAPGVSASFVVQFNPSATGAVTATLSVESNDADENPFTVTLEGSGVPGPGSRDTTFTPTFNATVYGAASDYLNREVLCGDFTTANGVSRRRLARLLSGGSIDPTLTGTAAGNQVVAVALQADGKLIVAGSFTAFNGILRNRIARINEDGTIDTTFNPNANGEVRCIDIDASGRILIGGAFTTVKSVARKGLAIVLPDGSLDTSFVPDKDSSGVQSAGFTPEGKVVAAGNSLYRFNSSGARDSTFGGGGEVTWAGSGLAIQLLPENKILLAGQISIVGGEARENAAIINEDGTTSAFDVGDATGILYSTNVQTDGKILLSGTFSEIGGEAIIDLARVDSTGDLDDSFVTNFSSGQVYGIVLQEDGKVLTVGSFTLESTPGLYAARLVNDPASDSISVVSPSSVQWLRSGSSPESTNVVFEYSQDSGTTWTSLGAATRIDGGWSATGISLPISGILRGLARIPGGYRNGSSSLLESRVAFSGLAVADITVQQPTNVIIADGGSLNFAGKKVGQTGVLSFTISNPGNATLSGISVVSTNIAEFAVSGLGATSLVAGGSTTFQVTFSPANIGVRSATLTVTSSVPGNKNPYTISLTGNGITTPLATTNTAISITSSTAVIRGTVTARDDSATPSFQWRLAPSGPWTTAAATPSSVSGFTGVSVSSGLTGLSSATLYNFRVGVVNSVTGPSSPVYGAIGSFTTL